MTASKRILVSGAGLILALGLGAGAQAQDLGQGDRIVSNFKRDRNVSVRERRHEGYEALGVRLGAFMAYPKATVAAEYNDNVYGSSVLEVDDTVLRIRPEVKLQSTWSRHALAAYANADFSRYSELSTEDHEEYAIGASGRLDIQRSASLSGGLDLAKLTEARTSTNTPTTTVSPVEYQLSQVYVAGSKEFNRLRLSGRLDWRDFDYEDGRDAFGGVVEQDDRDREIAIATARADYAVSPDTALFALVAVNKRNYDLAPPAVAASRDSDGYEVLAGANFELGAVARGEIGLGYVSQDYEDPAFEDLDGFGARAQVEWFPTQLATVTLTGSRTVEDSGIPGDAGYFASNVAIQLDYELLRNLIVTAQASFGEDEHEGLVARTDTRRGAGVSGTYLVSRNVGVTLTYNYLDQDSNVPFADFTQNRVAAGLNLQF